MSRVVIVGASVAGTRTAQALRAEGHDGEIVLIGDEAELPYDKPPLSKGFLAGTVSSESLTLFTRKSAEAMDVQLLLSRRATGLNVRSRCVEFENDQPLEYDHVVAATGARARPSPWGQHPGVHQLRTLRDAEQLRAGLTSGGPLVVVGGGLIGSEVASTAQSLGVTVTLVDPLAHPMSRILDFEFGEWFLNVYKRHGVQAKFGVSVEGIQKEEGHLRVKLSDGEELEAANVLVGIGAEPNDDWLRRSGVSVDSGLICDQYCRSVDTPGVYGVGDVTRWSPPDRREAIRLEHWTNAVEQAVCVAYNITHPCELRPYAPVEYVWSDQYGLKIQIVGRAIGSLRRAIVGDWAEGNRFAVLYSEDGQTLTGAVVINWPRGLVESRRAVAAGQTLNDVNARLEAVLAKSSPVRE